MKKINKLKLSKEIISGLQEKQMKSFLGGQVLFTGPTPYTSLEDCNTITQANSCATCPQAQLNPPATCCRKSCR